jgi:acetoin utilization protein AcuB
MQLRDIAKEDVFTVHANASIDDAIGLFSQRHVRHLPVVRDGLPIGMVSEGDVLVAVGGILADERVSNHDATVPYAGPTVVEQIMTTGVITLAPETPVAAGASVMLERQISAVVLVSGESIAGIVTGTDYLRQFLDKDTFVPAACRQQTVAEHMATEVWTANPAENVFALMRRMGRRIHHLPVVEDGRLVGILSDHDVRRALALDRIQQVTEPDARTRLMENFDARDIMNRDIQTATPTATLAEAAKLMIDNKIGALPVVAADELAGIITETDFLRACRKVLEDSP